MLESSLSKKVNHLINKTVEEEEKMEEDLDFFLDNNAIKKKKKKWWRRKKDRRQRLKPYTTTRTKSRNFLSNISYNGVKEEDLYDKNFIFDVYVLVTKNLNPFSLTRKIFDITNHKIAFML